MSGLVHSTPVVSGRRAVWPWSRDSSSCAAAEDDVLEARLQVVLDVLNRAATLRAIEAAELAVFEARTTGESARMAVMARAQIAMTEQFARHLAAIDDFRGRLTDEIIDALKQRALADFTDRMNRLAGADVTFNKDGLLVLVP